MPVPHRSRLPAIVAAALWLVLASGCSLQQTRSERDHLAAFSTRMTGMNEVPPVNTTATGTVDAVLDRRTRLLRWKMSYSNLSGPATLAHFHGPAPIGANAAVALAFAQPVASPYEGRAMLTQQQAADLLAGLWYVNVHTAAHPGGEMRGQMIERK